MTRTLDLATLRSFVAVADTGGVTKAAGVLHLTQSAVSMQIKRLEETLDVTLLERANRTVTTTSAGEQLLSYARRMLALNDEVWSRMTSNDFEGELTLGAPHDIIHPYLPKVLRQFAAEFPRMNIRLISRSTRALRAMFARGEIDAILTTEDEPGPGGEVLVELPLRWVGAKGGSAWRQTPLPIAFCSSCIFRSGGLSRLNDAGLAWEMVTESEYDQAVEAVVSADLAISLMLEAEVTPDTEVIQAGGALPDPGTTRIILYRDRTTTHVSPAADRLAEIVRATYRGLQIEVSFTEAV